MTRPSTLPGQIGGNRPGLGGNRPSTLPGQIGGIGGNRPGLGGNRPTTLPGQIGGIGGNRPGIGGGIGGNRPGLGGNRPTTLPGQIGGIGGNRPGLPGGGIGGNRPGLPGGGIGGNRPGLPGGGNWAGGGNRPPWGNGNNNLGNGNRPWGNTNNNLGNGNRPWGNGNGNWAGGGNRPWGNGNGSGNWGNGNWGIGGGNNIGSGNTDCEQQRRLGPRWLLLGLQWREFQQHQHQRRRWLGRRRLGRWRLGRRRLGRWLGWWLGRSYYGNWYRGGWGGSGFWGGFGLGALTSFGMSGLGYGMGYGYPYMGYGIYNYFPTWGVSNYSSWGLGSMANNWLYSGYTNPYYSNVMAAQPAQTTVVYDYSQPINVAADAPNPATAASTEQVFSAARDAFKAGDFQRALDLTDQVIKDSPNVPVVHEFRGLCLFALKRFDEAAAVEYAVLSAGPGWNWTTLVGLYPDVDTYTNQLRALEASVRSNPNSPSTEFLLGYHYLVQGHQDAAASQFEKVTKLQPTDQLSASFVKALKKAAEQPAQMSVAAAGQPAGAAPTSPAPAGQPPVAAAEQPQQQQPEAPPPPPPASLVGTWKAQPSPDLSISLTLQADGQFAWEVDSKGQKQTLTGQAGFKDNTLALLQQEGPPLVGKITEEGGNKFTFAPPTGASAKTPGLTFTKS